MVWSCPSPAGNRIKPPRSSSKGVQAYLASQTSPSTLGSVLAQARLHRNRFPRHSLIQSGDSSGKLQVSVPGWEWWCCSLIFDAPCDVFVKWPFMFEHVLLCAIEKSPSQSMEHLSTTKQFTQTKFPNWWSALNPGFPHHEHTTQYIFAICWGCHSLGCFRHSNEQPWYRKLNGSLQEPSAPACTPVSVKGEGPPKRSVSWCITKINQQT